jgi:hypothetical protein
MRGLPFPFQALVLVSRRRKHAYSQARAAAFQKNEHGKNACGTDGN